MNRSVERIRLLLGAAAVCGLLVVPVALAGSSPSAGGPKATASAGVKKRLKSLQRQIDALKAQVGKPGPQGAQGIQGIPGPGAISFDRQFPVDNNFHPVATVNGIVLGVECDLVGTGASVSISNVSHGWGTKAQNGALSHADVTGTGMEALAGNTAELDVVARPSAGGDPSKWTRFDLNGIAAGGVCTFHGVVIPSSSAG